ncbi:hypothetical protein [Novosphingobium cyanobacteriorum]|uniref:Uncharacterized protein n=1 Tax=Novosphingobium cyanobacteriorum TaxID=3024215 RepID=A0ABT6CNR4_9SPHN|nr:hypothetical protein [Novosphingobium cyanobacteriorum]MDF8335164.1 hypothetical protein [Novosphingobium cyanobacteriorum]
MIALNGFPQPEWASIFNGAAREGWRKGRVEMTEAAFAFAPACPLYKRNWSCSKTSNCALVICNKRRKNFPTKVRIAWAAGDFLVEIKE